MKSTHILLLTILCQFGCTTFIASQILTDATSAIHDLSITNDSMFLAAAGTNVYIYHRSGGIFYLNQTIINPSYIALSVHLTNDHQRLVVGTYQSRAYIYHWQPQTSEFDL